MISVKKKYEIVDFEDGILRFKQINHSCPAVKDVIFSVNTNKDKLTSMNEMALKNYALVANEFDYKREDPLPGEHFYELN